MTSPRRRSTVGISLAESALPSSRYDARGRQAAQVGEQAAQDRGVANNEQIALLALKLEDARLEACERQLSLE